jgi:formamidopyrimidine-DNA glycosylase
LPELPEVEICRRSLRRWCAGRRITAAPVEDPAAIRERLSTRPSEVLTDGEKQWSALVGQLPGALGRHGKRIGWTIGERGWLLHLGMTGKWIHRPSASPLPRFARLGLSLDDGYSVWFVDPRRFGCVAPVEGESLDLCLRAKLGPDALEEPLDGTQLRSVLKGRRKIKVALMDQAKLAGVGNIQAVEALWRAGLDPLRRCDNLSPCEFDSLAAALLTQLRWTITHEDEGEIQYLSESRSANPFQVYGRAGGPCPRCGGEILSHKHSGRTTFWCGSCQR